MSRIDVSTRRDGTVNRLEFYEGGKLVRTEEDANGDGQPDRRLTYGPSGVKTTKLR